MVQGEHSAILSTFIKLTFVRKIHVLSICEWPFYTDFIVWESPSGYKGLNTVCDHYNWMSARYFGNYGICANAADKRPSLAPSLRSTYLPN